MKKTILLFVAYLCFTSFVRAQIPAYYCSISNAAQIACNVYEFDIMAKRTGPTAFMLASFQCGINVNASMIPAGGVITVTMVPGSSQLDSSQRPSNAQFSYDPVYNCIQISPVTPPGPNNGSIISDTTPSLRLCRVRVTSTIPFISGTNPGHAWNFSAANGYLTTIYAYTGVGFTTLSDITVPASHILAGTYNPVFANLSVQHLISISPNHGIDTGYIYTAMIDGSFNNVTDVKLIKTGQADFILPFSLNSITTCGSQITATLDLQNKAVGYWDLVITTIDTTMIMQNAFMIDYPHINSISPNSGYNNGHAWANIYGYFYNVIHVKLTKTGQPDILSPDSLNNVTYYGSEIYADFNLLNKALGYWDLVVTTIDTTMILPNAFLIDTTNVIPISCFAHFTLIADTLVPHHYFGINNSYGISPINYLWNWGDSSTSTGPYPSHTYSVAGWYYICVTINDSTGCQSTYCDSSFLQKSTNTIVSIDVIPDVTIGISDYSTDNTFNIYPNPSPGLINIAFTGSTKETRVEILNSIGQVILTKEINNAITSLDLTNRAKGMYFIKVQSGNGVVLRKVIVE